MWILGNRTVVVIDMYAGSQHQGENSEGAAIREIERISVLESPISRDDIRFHGCNYEVALVQ